MRVACGFCCCCISCCCYRCGCWTRNRVCMHVKCVCVWSLANEKPRNRTAFTRNIIIIYWPIECNVPTLSNNKCVHLCIGSCVAVCATRTRHPAITSHITECQKCIFTFLNDYHRKKIYENKIKSIVRSVSMSGDSFLVGRIFKQS